MDEEINPFQAPGSVSAVRQNRSGDLASKISRLGAAFLDFLIMSAVILPLQFNFGTFGEIMSAIISGREPKEPSFEETLVWTVVGFVVLMAINGYWLATRAQTIGKMALGIKIVTQDENNASLNRIALQRVLPMQLLAIVPYVGWLIWLLDALFIFRANRRCLHDLIAGTKVVRV